jgi:hypothetical protein
VNDGVSISLHWDGRRWSYVHTPQPGGNRTKFHALTSVSCLSDSDCWAVGYAEHARFPIVRDLSEALHWDGSKWAVVATPQRGASDTNSGVRLAAVSCISAARCWAVGSFQPRGHGSNTLNLTMRWDGTKWSSIPTPQPAGKSRRDVDELSAVACISAHNCWAIGTSEEFRAYSRTEILHWNGNRWSSQRAAKS